MRQLSDSLLPAGGGSGLHRLAAARNLHENAENAEKCEAQLSERSRIWRGREIWRPPQTRLERSRSRLGVVSKRTRGTCEVRSGGLMGEPGPGQAGFCAGPFPSRVVPLGMSE